MRRDPAKSARRKAPKSWAEAREAAKAAARKKALRALEKARRAAAAAGVELTGWEDEFLGSVADRVKTFGRAFADPEKGAEGAALSARQALKLKQIALKAKAAAQDSDARRTTGESAHVEENEGDD